jgi:hypothetical protein
MKICHFVQKLLKLKYRRKTNGQSMPCCIPTKLNKWLKQLVRLQLRVPYVQSKGQNLKPNKLEEQISPWPSCYQSPLSTKDLMNHLKLYTLIYICFALCIMLTVIFKTGPRSNILLVEAQGTMPLVSCLTFLLKIDYWKRNKHKKDLLTSALFGCAWFNSYTSCPQQ